MISRNYAGSWRIPLPAIESLPRQVTLSFPGSASDVMWTPAASSIAAPVGQHALACPARHHRNKDGGEAQTLLVDELNHRVKNTLATVQAIASQTLHSATVDDLNGFIARLRALARAHDALTEITWGPARVRDILNRA